MMNPSDDQIDRAVAILRRGGLVSFPTETVYGLGADATNSNAISKIFAAKGRPAVNPLIVHAANVSQVRQFVTAWPDSADRLSRAFWPGPLTLVLPKASRIVPEVTAGLETVAIRCPDHPLALRLLNQFDGPVAAPSANRSTRISPTTAEHVRRELGDKVDLILDGGPCRVGIESTVVDLVSDPPRLLRLGAISRQQLEELIGPVAEQIHSISEIQPAQSPGQQAVHYSPVTPAFRITQAAKNLFPTLFHGKFGGKGVFLIIHDTELGGELQRWAGASAIIELPASPEGYAQRLYAALHEADERTADVIWVQDPPAGAQWDAVRDRVRRATRGATEA